MTKDVLLILAATGLIVSSACKKKENPGDDVNTQQIAQTNKGRFVCLVNSKEWLGDAANKKHVVNYWSPGFSFKQDVYGAEGNIFGDTLTLKGCRVAGTDSGQLVFDLVLRNGYHGSYSIGNFPPKNAGTASAHYYHKMGKAGIDIARSGYNLSGVVNITHFNDSMRFCSGNFEINMSPKNSGDSKTPAYKVTKGVFYDVKFD